MKQMADRGRISREF
jgi:hypothetical protein